MPANSSINDDLNNEILPWIEASNEDGYAVTFFPLTLSNEAVIAVNLLGLTENTLLEVDDTIAT